MTAWMWIHFNDTTVGEKGKLKIGTQGMVPLTQTLKTQTVLYIIMGTDICGKSINMCGSDK